MLALPAPVRVATVFNNMLSYSQRVVNAYTLYQHFLTGLQNACHVGERRKEQNLTHARRLFRLSCDWKGGRTPPSRETLVNVCALKQIPTLDSDSKFEMYKRFIFRLKEELLESNVNTLDDFMPQSPQAVELHAPQVDVKIRAPTVNTRPPWTRLVTVGAKHFADMSKFRAYIKTGQHAAHATPCVIPTKIDWNHPIVFEEWLCNKSWQGRIT